LENNYFYIYNQYQSIENKLVVLVAWALMFFGCKKNAGDLAKSATDGTKNVVKDSTKTTTPPKDTVTIPPKTYVFQASDNVKDTIGGSATILSRVLTANPLTVKFTFNHAQTEAITLQGNTVSLLKVKVPAGATTGPLYATVNSDNVKVRDTFYVVRTKFEWKKLKPFPGGKRDNGVAFVINNKAYFGLGENLGVQAGYNDLWQYAPESDSWTQKANMPKYGNATGRQGGFSFVYNNKAYIGGGRSQNYENLSDINTYDPQTNSWTWLVNAANNPSIAVSVACFYKNIAYIFSGNGGMIKYDPYLNDYTQVLPYTDGYRNGIWYGVANNMLAGGTNGRTYNFFGKDGKMEEISNNNIPQPAELGSLRLAIGYQNSMYMSFGDQGYLWKYDFLTGNWTVIARQKMGITGNTTSFMLGSKIYFVGGTIYASPNNIPVDDVWMIDVDPYIR
jgi:N-acetylneuraminic acid mutarotase